jgi:hypothetical protein
MKIHTAQMTVSTEREEWYTPAGYITAVRETLGSIDLDPCSCALANETVQASHYITRDEDALSMSWPAVNTLYCNPPYSAGVIGRFIERILEHHAAGGFRTGIVLINNVSDTRYWQKLARASSLYCMTDHRISFVNMQGQQIRQNTRGQTLFLLEHSTAQHSTAQHSTAQGRFTASFRRFGVIAQTIQESTDDEAFI